MGNKYNYIRGPVLHRHGPVASGVKIEIGDLLKKSGSYVTPCITTTDNLAFVGVAVEAKTSTKASGEILYAVPSEQTVFEFDLDTSTAVIFEDLFQINAKQTLKKSTTDPIAKAHESKLAATRCEVVFLLTNSSSIKNVGDAS